MIIEDYISFETAKLLKEKEFVGENRYWYTPDGFIEEIGVDDGVDPTAHDDIFANLIPALTLQMAMKRVREVYHLHCQIDCPAVSSGWQYGIYDLRFKDWRTMKMMGNFDTYEEAAEAAIIYCLKELI